MSVGERKDVRNGGGSQGGTKWREKISGGLKVLRLSGDRHVLRNNIQYSGR